MQERKMVDRPFGNLGAAVKLPELRLTDVRTELMVLTPPFRAAIAMPGRSVLVHVRRGDFHLDVEGVSGPAFRVPGGSSVGFEAGRAHAWFPADETAAERMELFVSSIPRRYGVLQGLENGMIIVPPDALPFAEDLRQLVDVQLRAAQDCDDDHETIIQRCAEICLIDLIRFARQRVAGQSQIPAALAYDENLARAWSAYLASPNQRWTVQALANAARLGRTVFAERFRAVFGAPPLETLTRVRLDNARDMLTRSRAPLSELAYAAGYGSEAAFVRAFHRKFGVTPGRFRADRFPPVRRDTAAAPSTDPVR